MQALQHFRSSYRSDHASTRGARTCGARPRDARPASLRQHRYRMIAKVIAAIAIAGVFTCEAKGDAVHWEKQTLTADFVSEGASVADFDGDGHVDLASGPYWWRGPDFNERFEYRKGKPFDPKGYSDHFFSFTADVDGDSDADVISIGFPGKEATAYLNPGDPVKHQSWPAHVIADQVSNESPTLVDLVAGGLPELVCSRDGAFGYYQAGEDPKELWTWHAVSPDNVTHKPFGHGLGVGDVDGDGRLDVVDPTRWWKQPSEDQLGKQWEEHVWALQPYGGGGAQILVHDVDGDGLNDIVTSLNAHGYGLAWFAQKKNDGQQRRFIRHDVLGESSIDNPYGVVFSQLHALALADIDGDGFQDVVTGKRYWAHGGNDPGGGQAPVLYWFSGARQDSGEIRFEPSLVDDDSGVGTEVVVTDMNGDGMVDIVSSNKRGVAIHFQHRHSDGDSALGVWNEGAMDESAFAQSRGPQDAAESMQVPDGFSVDLIAAEPDLSQPIAMCFDTRGRIWVAEGHTYPKRAPEGEGRDRIVILEDTDRDGSFEKKTIFADGLNLVSGIEIGFGGVWVGAAPYFMFIPDVDGDDVPDSEPQILLDGWGYHDTHETLNSFTWGPDGWLYGCHGVFTHSKVGKPGTPDDLRKPLNAAIWRYHPTRHEFEVFAWGGSNQWGIDYNDQGDWFMECCVIPHLFHVIQGARYHRQAGQHFNPYIYEDLPTIADHLHYGDGTFASMRDGGRVDRDLVRRKAASTSMVGGGHAHCGMAIYLGDSFPASYYGDLFFNNLHGHRVVRESVLPDGSGYTGHHRPDLVRTIDHAFVGVGVMLGTDGSLYFSDWHDPQTCHNRDPEVWDRSNGRIFRLRYGAAKSTAIGLVESSDRELIQNLTHSNGMVARQSAQLLQQRAAAGALDLEVAASEFQRLETSHGESKIRLRTLWARHCCGMIAPDQLLTLMKDDDPYIRGWAIQLYAERADLRTAEDWTKLAEATAGEASLVTLRYLASALQRIPLESRAPLAHSIASHRLFAKDKNLPLLVWYAVEPLVAADASQTLARFGSNPLLRSKVIRRAATSPSGRDALATAMAKSAGYDQLLAAARDFRQWLPAEKNLGRPSGWDRVRKLGDDLIAKRGKDDQQLLDKLRQLGVRLGDASSFPYYRARAVDHTLDPKRRIEAVDLISQAGDPQAGQIAASVLGEPAMQAAAVRAIVASGDPKVAPKVLENIAELPIQWRNDLINFLASRASTASMLLGAIESKSLDRSIVSAVLLRQIQAHDDPELRPRVEKIWGRVGKEPGNFQKQKQAWKRVLTRERLANADLAHGRFIYDQACGNCHKLFGDGKEIGPDLTGSNRRDLNYILENVLAPNAIIGKDYQMHAFLMDDGRLITGLIREETERLIRVVMTAGTEVVLDPNEVESRKLSEQSMMPMEQFDKMHQADVADLVAYLAGEKQVKPSERRSLRPGESDPANLVEAEWLADSARPTAGTVRPQAMGGFAGKWSGDRQLWWTGSKKGGVLELEVLSPHSGPCQVSIHLTTAVDYPIMRARVDQQPWQSADLFTKEVRQLPRPLRWSNVPLQKGQPMKLSLEMTGSNPLAIQRWMLGIDCIEIVPTSTPSQ